MLSLPPVRQYCILMGSFRDELGIAGVSGSNPRASTLEFNPNQCNLFAKIVKCLANLHPPSTKETRS
jgi:hypothetical protein